MHNDLFFLLMVIFSLILVTSTQTYKMKNISQSLTGILIWNPRQHHAIQNYYTYINYFMYSLIYCLI